MDNFILNVAEDFFYRRFPQLMIKIFGSLLQIKRHLKLEHLKIETMSRTYEIIVTLGQIY